MSEILPAGGTPISTTATTTSSNTVNEWDVLSGRGDAMRTSVGNIQFRTWVNLFQDQYTLGPESEKMQISARIIAMVQESGGRFMTFNHSTKTWQETSIQKAMVQTLRALREPLPGTVGGNAGSSTTTTTSVRTDPSLKLYRERFYQLWDSKPVRDRAQQLFNFESSTRSLSNHPNSRTFVPTSDDFVLPSLPPTSIPPSETHQDKKKTKKESKSSGTTTSSSSSTSRVRSDDRRRPPPPPPPPPQSRKSLSKKEMKKSKQSTQQQQPKRRRTMIITEHIHTTLDGLPIRAATLDLDEVPSSDSDTSTTNVWDVTPKIRRTSIVLSKREHRQPLYDFDLDLPDTDDEEAVPLYGALHDLDELVALGIVKPSLPLAQATTTSRSSSDTIIPTLGTQQQQQSHDQEDSPRTTHTIVSTPRKLRARPPKRAVHPETGRGDAATSKRTIHERKNYPRLFGPGQPIWFGGGPPPPSTS